MEKIWLKNYPKEVPATINPDRYASLNELFTETCQKFSEQAAFSNLGTTLTFSDTYRYAKAFSSYLINHLKLKKGDRVAIIMPNLLQYPIALFGTLLAGCTVVNVNPLYTAPEMLHQLRDAEVSAVVIVKNFAETLENVLHDFPIKHVIITGIGDLCPWPKSLIVNAVVKYVKRMIPAYRLPKAIPFLKVLKRGRRARFTPPEIGGNDLAFLQYTGGTTGISKGAMLTHRNMVANVEQVYAWISPFSRVDQQEIMITALPMYHVFCLQANILTFMKLGTHNVLITNPRDLDTFVKTIAHLKFTVMTGVNTLFNALLNHPKFAQVDFSEFQIALGGGMAVQKAVAERWEAVTGTPLIEGYGLTESSPVIAIHPLNVHHYIEAIGLPVSSTEIAILDPNHQPLGVNETGEIWVRGPQVMLGYWRRPEETKKVLTADGWLATGDIGKVDAEGFLYLLERQKDMIIVSGFNVYPNEVEAAIMEIPGVLEVGVVGVPCERTGEQVKAVIVRNDAQLTEEAIIAHCHERLARYKIPKLIEFRHTLPKSNVGKILRRALRESAEATVSESHE